jgi:predicted heme/steroid binding protein/uncharacterized membrane protein
MATETQEFDEASLKERNGDNDTPVYVAYKGKVYDLSGSKLWKTGTHMNRHHAGADMTTDIQSAPHTPDVLEKFPQVGIFKTQVQDRNLPAFLSALLIKFPMLKRHPHPMIVHFPIVFVFSVLMFDAVYLMTGIKTFEITSYHCLEASILFTPVAIITGFYTWWLNYMAKKSRPILVKQICSIILFAVEIVLFAMRHNQPEIFYSINGLSLLFSAIMLIMVIIVTVIGWYGAILTFPVKKG